MEKTQSVDKEHMASAPTHQAPHNEAAIWPEKWTVEIDGEASKELTRVMSATGYSMERLIATAIQIMGILADARRIGNRVFIVHRGGRLLKEIFLPENAS